MYARAGYARIQHSEKEITNWTLFLFIFIVAYDILPIVSRFVSSFLTTYVMLGVVGLLYLYFLTWNFGGWLRATFPLLLVTIITLLHSLSSGGFNLTTIYGTLLGFLPILIALRLKAAPVNQQQKVFRTAFAGLIITAVTSIVGLTIMPGTARVLATTASTSDPILIRSGWYNIGGFSFTYMLTVVYPMMICYAKEKKWGWPKKVFLFLIVLAFYIKAEYMTGMLMFLALSVLWLMPARLSVGKTITIIAGIAIGIQLLRDPLADLLMRFANTADSVAFRERLAYLADYLRGISSTSDVGKRIDVLKASVNGFLSHPIFGTWYLKGRYIGGHSYLLDFISNFGLIGIGLQVAVYHRIYKLFYAAYAKSRYFGYVLCAIISAVVLSTINTGDHWFELTLIVPLFLEMINTGDACCIAEEKKEAV